MRADTMLAAAPEAVQWPVVPVAPAATVSWPWSSIEPRPTTFMRQASPSHCTLNTPNRPRTGPLKPMLRHFIPLKAPAAPKSRIGNNDFLSTEKLYQGVTCRSPASSGWAGLKIPPVESFAGLRFSTPALREVGVDAFGHGRGVLDDVAAEGLTPPHKGQAGAPAKDGDAELRSMHGHGRGTTPGATLVQQQRREISRQIKTSQLAQQGSSDAFEEAWKGNSRLRKPDKQHSTWPLHKRATSPSLSATAASQESTLHGDLRRAATSARDPEGNQLLGVVGCLPGPCGRGLRRVQKNWDPATIAAQLAGDSTKTKLSSQFGGTLTATDTGGADMWLGNTPQGFYPKMSYRRRGTR